MSGKFYDQLLGLLLTVHRNIDILSGAINTLATLAKMRPIFLPVVIQVLASWTPKHLEGLPAFNIKSVEKAIRILLLHLSK